MDSLLKIPFYAKAALIFISIFAFVFTLYVGQQIIVPILYATIIAILLNPLVNFLVRKRINKIIAITIALVLALSVLGLVIYIFTSRLTLFSETFPILREKFKTTSILGVEWLSEKVNIHESTIHSWITKIENEGSGSFTIIESFSQITHFMVLVMLIPAYLCMILYYKPLLLEFIRKMFKEEHHVAVAEVLVKSKTIIQSYLVGLFFEMIIVAALNSSALLLLGIDYAIILGITGAVVNIIPYIGGMIAIILPIVVALLTTDSLTSPVLVFIVYIIIQFIDNHYIIPNIVARRVKLNALISIVVILIGGTLWGIPGMFLSIPLTAIAKVIFDHIEPLKPWGFLLGNIVPTTSKFSFIKQRDGIKIQTEVKKIV